MTNIKPPINNRAARKPDTLELATRRFVMDTYPNLPRSERNTIIENGAPIDQDGKINTKDPICEITVKIGETIKDGITYQAANTYTETSVHRPGETTISKEVLNP